MRNVSQFVEDQCPSRQDQFATLWRAQVDAQRSLAVIQYAGEDTYVARAMHLNERTSHGITTRRHRTRREAAREAIRLSQILYLRISSETNTM